MFLQLALKPDRHLGVGAQSTLADKTLLPENINQYSFIKEHGRM